MNFVIDVSTFLENRLINEEDAAGCIHAEFPKWLATYVNDKANGVANKDIIALSHGGALHTSGRKAHVDVALELSNNLQKDLFPDELFLRTHKRKSGAWVDTRSEDTYAKYNKKLATAQAQIGETSGDGVQKKLTNLESDVFRV
ncbi:hypothetical protein P8452_17464 [Trifolium repens]|nr:hypothetical protein P8452_17464 [Trifolium repens]